MRKYLLRIENLLLLFPFLLLLPGNVYYKDGTFDIHLHDTYIILQTFHLFIGIFLFFLVPCFFLTLLRWKKSRLDIVCNLHLFFTFLLFIGTAIFFLKADDMNQMKQVSYLIWSQVALQCLFIFYTLTVFIKNPGRTHL